MPRLKRLKLVAVVSMVLALFFVTFPVYAVGETWNSFNDSAREVPDETFSGAETTVYMEGAGYAINTNYRVAYYETDTGDGDEADLLVWQTKSSNPNGVLKSQLFFPTYDVPTTDAGLWHSVVFPTTITPPNPYDATGAIADDTFTVDASAIPEFPTMMAMMVAMGLSAGIYYWMRKRYHKQAAVA